MGGRGWGGSSKCITRISNFVHSTCDQWQLELDWRKPSITAPTIFTNFAWPGGASTLASCTDFVWAHYTNFSCSTVLPVHNGQNYPTCFLLLIREGTLIARSTDSRFGPFGHNSVEFQNGKSLHGKTLAHRIEPKSQPIYRHLGLEWNHGYWLPQKAFYSVRSASISKTTGEIPHRKSSVSSLESRSNTITQQWLVLCNTLVL